MRKEDHVVPWQRRMASTDAAAQPCLISPHQTAIALDIRCEDRGRLSFDGVRFQGSGWFTEGFDTADLKEAKALLAELA